MKEEEKNGNSRSVIESNELKEISMRDLE